MRITSLDVTGVESGFGASILANVEYGNVDLDFPTRRHVLKLDTSVNLCAWLEDLG